MKSIQRLLRTHIRTTQHGLALSVGSDPWKTIPIADLESIAQGAFLGFPFIHIVTRSGGHTVLRGETAPVIEALQTQLEDLAVRCFRHADALLAGVYPSLKTLDQAWARTVSDLGDSIPTLRSPFVSILLGKNYTLDQTRSLWDAMEKTGEAREQLRRIHVETEIDSFKEYFDTVEKMPLTDEQREACVVADDRQILVAAAGSGKSSTITAKVGYLLKKGWVKPEEIVVLAFNSDAAKEIKERCLERLREISGIEKITCSTFHAFGRNLSRSQFPNGRIPQVSPMATADGTALRHSLLRWIVQDLIFSSGSQTTADAFKMLQDVTKGNDSPSLSVKANEKRAPFLTLRGEKVNSIQEQKIADFLHSYGIMYEYEQPYKFDVSDADHAQYRPDFYFPTIDVYYEHFAINSKGEAPPDFAGYLEKTKWRREIHPKMGTLFFETLSADFEDRSIFDKILYWLHEFGYDFENDISSRIAKGAIEINEPAIATLDQFISNRKLSGITDQKLYEKASMQSPWIGLLLPFVIEVGNRYEKALRQYEEIDFTDMILMATKAIEASSEPLPFRYFLIDEFQDISAIRADMVRALLRRCPGSKLFCVGDDWQSINGFSGSELKLMTRFQQEFGEGTEQYLTQTFRSNQGIATVAATFVMRNPDQLPKKVVAHDKSERKVIEVHLMDTEADLEGIFWNILQQQRRAPSKRKKTTIFALARYNHYFAKNGRNPNPFEACHKHWIEQLALEGKDDFSVEMETFHRSKGRECDIAILLGLVTEKGNKRSVPSRMPEDKLTQLPLMDKEPFPDAEERRLFYVAMTRARHKVVIPTLKKHVSPFLAELRNFPEQATFFHQGRRLESCHSCDTGFTARQGIRITCNNHNCELGIFNKSIRCPACGQGTIAALSGQFGIWIGCSNYPSCKHTHLSAPSRNLSQAGATEAKDLTPNLKDF